MSRNRLFVCLLALSMAAGCKAQPAVQSPADPALNRHIEVLVRAQLHVPQDYAVVLGVRKPSAVPGYDSLSITFSLGANKQVVEFLISSDNKTLAHLDTFSLDKDPAFSINVAGRPIRGNPAAPVTVVSFDDLECGYCAKMHQTLFPAALDRYKDKVRFIYKDDPLVDLHPWAMHAAVDANCLAAQNGEVYWKYVDYLHLHGQEVNGAERNLAASTATLDRIARQEATLARLDATQLDACLTKQDQSQVLQSSKDAETLHVEGTPALFVNGERIDGAIADEQIWVVIDRALNSAGVTPPPSAASQSAGDKK